VSALITADPRPWTAIARRRSRPPRLAVLIGIGVAYAVTLALMKVRAEERREA
jgi:hypothetical protein